MRVAQSIPRRMRFDADAASSVELCVSEWASGSRYRDEMVIVAERSDRPPLLDGVEIFRLAPAKRLSSLHLAFSIRRQLGRRIDLIVTQQHIPTAARIAWINRGTPVVLQTHNFVDAPATGKGAALRNRLRRVELQSLAGITLISECVKAQFERDWPEVTIPRTVVTNGFDFRTWRPATEREKNILVVGRNQPEKGILESAQGCAPFLVANPDWRATFILSEIGRRGDYLAEVRAALAPAGDRAEIVSGIPFADVKAMTERAAISIVASRWIEPFGRTALEAHAGGAALISSGTGGLAEISGDAALMLPEITGPAIHAALARLAHDDGLRDDLVRRGGARVRRLFPLTAAAAGGAMEAVPVCERLDAFFDQVARRPAAHAISTCGAAGRRDGVSGAAGVRA